MSTTKLIRQLQNYCYNSRKIHTITNPAPLSQNISNTTTFPSNKVQRKISTIFLCLQHLFMKNHKYDNKRSTKMVSQVFGVIFNPLSSHIRNNYGVLNITNQLQMKTNITYIFAPILCCFYKF